MLELNKELLAVAEKKYEDELAALKINNVFADNLDEHLDVAESHMIRMEQAINDEL